MPKPEVADKPHRIPFPPSDQFHKGKDNRSTAIIYPPTECHQAVPTGTGNTNHGRNQDSDIRGQKEAEGRAQGDNSKKAIVDSRLCACVTLV